MQKTTLGISATPGKTHTFMAKASQEPVSISAIVYGPASTAIVTGAASTATSEG